MLYLSQERYEETLSDCLGYFTERVFIFTSTWLLLSDCLAFYDEKVFILLCFYMLYLSQERHEEPLSDCLSFYEERVFIFVSA